MIGSFTEVKPMFYWVQHILPLVYDDSLSYMELLGKVTKTLNELVENNSLLPDYIMKLIKEYISSGEIEKVLAEVLANYMLNVKFPPKGLTPAVGDGSADDTEAIQGCINYAYQNGGMAVYFPSGAYLTQPLTLNEKVTLFGQDRYTTRIVMKGGATKPLFTGTVDEMSLTGLGFDGNMDIQVNNVNLFTITVNSAIITNCLLTDGYDLLNITVNNELQLDNILFRHAVENALVVGGAGYVQGDNLIFKSLSTLIGKNYIVLNTNKSILEEVKCFGAAPNGVLIGGNSNVVNMWCEACQTPYVDNGTNNTIHVYGASEDEKFTGDVTQYIGGFLNQTVVATKKLVARNIIDTAGETRQESTAGNKTETVNGNDTETVGGDKKETVSGSKSVIVTLSLDENIGTNKISVIKGTNTETITGLSTENANGGKALISTDYNENVINRNITAAKIEETLTGNKTVTAANITETVSGDYTINGGDMVETLDNKTVHITTDTTEQTDGSRTITVAGTNNETTGTRTETVNGDKNITATNITETITEQKTIKSPSILLDTLKLIHGENIINVFNGVKAVEGYSLKDGTNYKVIVDIDENVLTDYNYLVIPEQFGAKADGITDDTDAINQMLEYCYTNKRTASFSPGKTYATATGIVITHKIDIAGNYATIKAINKQANCIYFNLPNSSSLSNTVENLLVDCNNLADKGINYEYVSGNILNNCFISNFLLEGLYVKQGFELYVNNLFIRESSSVHDGIGINALASDCYYNNVVMLNCHIGIKCKGSNTYNNIHAWIYVDEKDYDLLRGSIMFDVVGRGEHIFNSPYIDTYSIMWNVSVENARVIVSNAKSLNIAGEHGFGPSGINEQTYVFFNTTDKELKNVVWNPSVLTGVTDEIYTVWCNTDCNIIFHRGNDSWIKGLPLWRKEPGCYPFGTTGQLEALRTPDAFYIIGNLTLSDWNNNQIGYIETWIASQHHTLPLLFNGVATFNNKNYSVELRLDSEGKLYLQTSKPDGSGSVNVQFNLVIPRSDGYI